MKGEVCIVVFKQVSMKSFMHSFLSTLGKFHKYKKNLNKKAEKILKFFVKDYVIDGVDHFHQHP